MLVLFEGEARRIALSPGCAGAGLRDAVWTAVRQQVVDSQTVAVRLVDVGRIVVPAAGVRLQVCVTIDRLQSVLRPGEVVSAVVTAFDEHEISAEHRGTSLTVPAAFFPAPLCSRGAAFAFEGGVQGPWRVGDALALSILRVERDGVAVAAVPAALLGSGAADAGGKRKFSAR